VALGEVDVVRREDVVLREDVVHLVVVVGSADVVEVEAAVGLVVVVAVAAMPTSHPEVVAVVATRRMTTGRRSAITGLAA